MGDFMKGGIYFHPGHPELMDFLAEDEVGAYMKITTPQAFGDTPDSSPNVRPGGIASQIIETTFFEEYESPCDHGFFNRGDLEDLSWRSASRGGWTTPSASSP